MGIRRELMEKRTEMVVEEEKIIVGYARQGKERWRIVGVYVNGNVEQKLRKVEHWMKNKVEGVKIIIGGDFNARKGGKDSERSADGKGGTEEKIERREQRQRG